MIKILWRICFILTFCPAVLISGIIWICTGKDAFGAYNTFMETKTST